MGVLSFASLIVKRHFDTIKRPTKIWILDISKQLLSQMLGHMLNVVFSVFISSKKTKDIPVGTD